MYVILVRQNFVESYQERIVDHKFHFFIDFNHFFFPNIKNTTDFYGTFLAFFSNFLGFWYGGTYRQNIKVCNFYVFLQNQRFQRDSVSVKYQKNRQKNVIFLIFFVFFDVPCPTSEPPPLARKIQYFDLMSSSKIFHFF